MTGSSLVGSRWIGVEERARSGDANIALEGPSVQGSPGAAYDRWFPRRRRRRGRHVRSGSVVGVFYQLSGAGPYALGPGGAPGGATLATAACSSRRCRSWAAAARARWPRRR